MVKVLRFASVLLFLLVTGFAGRTQTTLFYEKMGLVTTNTTFATHTSNNGWDNSATLTFSDGGVGTSGDVRRTSNIATDGTNDANIWMAGGARGFAIEGINAASYSGLTLSFYYRKESGTVLPSITLEYWNGSSWVGQSFSFAQATNATANWYQVSNITLPAGAQINGLKIRWRQTHASNAFRLDQILLTGTASASAPTLTTPTATSITNDGATIGATISNDGGASITARGTVWDFTATPTGNQLAEGGTATGAFSHARTGMGVNTQIYYRGYATNSQGTSYSPDGSFYTLANVPGAPTVNGATTSTLDVAVNVNSNPSITTFAIQETGGQYVQGDGTLGASPVWQTAAAWGTVTVNGLSPSTMYTFQVKARNGDNVETAFGATASGTTTAASSPPTINNQSATATYGTAFSYTIVATDFSGANPFSSGALPAGLSLNTSTGEISGTPTTLSGSPYSINISASNGAGTSNATLTLTIDPKNLTISGGISIASKVYDATNAATIIGTPTLSGVVGGDNVSATGGTATFNSVNVGGSVATTISGYTLTGPDASNYTVTQPSGLTGAITAKALTMSGLSVPASKTYDGTTTASVSGTPTLQTAQAPGAGNSSDGIPYTGDAVSITGTATGTYNSADVLTATTVTFGGLSLTGAQAANYTLTIQAPAAATITKANQTINFPAFGAKNTASPDFSPGATSATSGINPITYVSGTLSVATIVAGPNIHIVGVPGTSVITASQAASDNYNAAPDVQQTLTVDPGPCLSESFTGATFPPTGWLATSAARSTTSGDYVTGPAGAVLNQNNGSITFPSVGYPTSMSFYLGRSSNTTAKTLNVRVSTTSQSSGFSAPIAVYDHSNVPSGSYNQYTVDLSAYNSFSTVWVQLEKVSTTTSPWRIDDIEITCSNACSAPTLTTSAATSITTTGATLNGEVTSVGANGATAVTTRGFQYSTSNTLASPTTINSTGSFGAGTYSNTIASGLTHNTVYYFNAYAINDCGTPQTGNSHTSGYPTFTTIHNAPTVGAGSAATSNSFTASWTAPAGGGGATYTYEIEVDDNIGFGSPNFILGGIPSGTTSANVNSGLSPSTTYYFRVRAVNAGGNSAWSATSVGYATLAASPSIAVTGQAHNSTFTYANTAIGGGFTDETFTITNNGTATLNISSIVVSGAGFAIQGSVPTTVASGGGAATFTVRFTPSSATTFSGSVVINNNASPAAYTINLSGTGVVPVTYANGDWVSGTGTGLLWTNAATWQRVVGGVLTFTGGTPNTGASDVVWIRGGVSTNGSRSALELTIENGGTLTVTASGTVSSKLLVETGGTIQINAALTVSGTFEIENGGTAILNFLANNTSAIWNGTEIFHENSNFIITQWNANHGTTANRPIFNGSNISVNTYSGYTAAFGNLTISMASATITPNTLVLVSSSSNLAHGDLNITDGGGESVAVSSTGTVTSGVGGNVTMTATSDPFFFKTSGTGVFTIGGNLQLNAGATSVFTSSSAGSTSTLNINGDLNITSTASLNGNSTVAGGTPPPAVTINLKGDLTVASGALLQNSNTSSIATFNFTGTGDGLTAATTQTIDIATTGANENRYIAFNVTNGAYVQLINRDFQIGNSSSVTVATGGVLDFGFTGATANNLTEVPATATATAFTLANSGKIKISHPNGIDAHATLTAEGNVRLDTRTYSTTGIYHYIGKAPSQRLGDGLPAASSGKYVIVELDALTTSLVYEGYNGTAYIGTGNIGLSNAGNGLKIIQGTVIGTTTADFTGNANLEMTGGLYQINVPAATSIVPQLSGLYTMTGGTVEINSTAAAQSLRGSRTYFGLTVSGAAPTTVLKSITDNIGVNGVLTFAANGGVLTTNAFKVTIGAAGSVSGASQANGWVHGFLEKNVATGSGVLRDFEVGDAANYAPVNLEFANVSANNNITASTIGADHANIATSRVVPTKSINRNWTVTNGGVGFSTYKATFNFRATDADGGVNTNQLFVAKYDAPTWTYPTTGARSATSVQIKDVTSFSDFQIGEVDTFIWNGTVSTAWADSVNWSPNSVPVGCPDHIIIPAGTPFSPTISVADISVGNVDIASGATLTLAGKNLTVCGNWFGGTAVTNASVLGTGTTFMNNGSVAQTINGKTRFNILQINNAPGVSLTTGTAVSIGVGLHLQAGNLNVSSGTLRLLSTAANNYSYIDNFSFGVSPGTLTGSILADRFIPVGGRNQHFISSPVDAPALSQISASGPDGSYITPTVNCDENHSATGSSYGSVFVYDDGHQPNNACMLGNWMVKSAGTMDNAKGYSAYLQGNSILTLSGVANSGDMSIAVKNSGFNTVNTAQAQPIQSGWNLVGNPYPSAIDMTVLRDGLGFSNEVQVWKTTGPFKGSWQVVVIDGTQGKVVIPPFQGFMVRRTAPGNSTYPFFQSERSRNATQTFYRTGADNSLTLELDFNGAKDVTTVDFNKDATVAFDDRYDATKSGAMGRPTLYTHLNTNMWYAINTLESIKTTSTVPMGLRPEADGLMTITPQGIGTFDPTTYIMLEDKKTGTWHNLRNGAYTFTASKTDNQQRFVLHFTPAAEVLVTDASCSESGVINVQQPGSANWTYKIEDQNNTSIATGVLNSSNSIGVNVTAGVYMLTLTDNNGYTVMKNIQVNGVQPIVASFNLSLMNAQINESITFTATTTAVVYSWDFGDGTTATTSVANHQYASEGVYLVKLTVTNAEGCQSTTTQSVTITSRSTTGIGNQSDKTNIQIWSSDNRVFIDFGKITKVDADIEFYNVIGQLVSHERFGRSTVFTKELNHLEAGYIIVKVTNEDRVTTKRVFIGK